MGQCHIWPLEDHFNSPHKLEVGTHIKYRSWSWIHCFSLYEIPSYKFQWPSFLLLWQNTWDKQHKRRKDLFQLTFSKVLVTWSCCFESEVRQNIIAESMWVEQNCSLLGNQEAERNREKERGCGGVAVGNRTGLQYILRGHTPMMYFLLDPIS
jgi:hypothetical protein